MTPTPVDPKADLLALKQQEIRLLRLKNEAIKRDGLPFYRPHPKQDKFHRSTAKRRGVFTGNRFGKSHMGLAEDIAWVRGERPWFPKDDPARKAGIPQHPVKGIVLANDWDKVQEVFTGQDGKLWRFLPSDMIKATHRNHSGAVDTLFLHNGSSLRFDTVQSFKSNPQGSESSDWDFIHVDEPVPEAMFKAHARGLMDRNGSAWFTLTALKEPWITDAFEPNGIFDGFSYVIEGSIYDNPFITPEAIKLYEATLTEDEKECRLYGKPLFKAGLVYKAFQRDKHVLVEPPRGWKDWLTPPHDWSYYLYIDPHPHVPLCALGVTIDPRGRAYYWFDLFEKLLIKDFVERIKMMMAGRRLVRVRMDPTAWIEDPVDGTTWASEFAKHGLVCEKASKDLSRGIVRVNEELRKTDFFPLFSPMCKRTIWEIGRYCWDEEKGKPVDKDDHAMECLYRSVLDEPRWVDPALFGKDNVINDVVFDRTPDLRRDEEPLGPSDEIGITSETLMLN